MKIDPSQLPQPKLLLEVAKIKAQVAELKLGEQLNLRVTAHNNSNQQYTLKNNQLQAQLKTTLPLELGQTVKVEVMSNGQKPQLQIISPSANQLQLQQTLRSLWSQQMPPDKNLNNMAQLLSNPLSSKTLPEPIIKLIGQLFNALPNSKTLSSFDGLKQTLRDSGMFLESKLARTALSGQPERQHLDRDIKALTLRLVLLLRDHTLSALPQQHTTTAAQPAQQLYPAILLEQLIKRINKQSEAKSDAKSFTRGEDFEQQLKLIRELIKGSESTLARQQLNQINSSSDEQKVWGFEIPMNNGKEISLFKLKIASEEQSKQNEEEEQRWQVTLNLELPAMGPLQVQITLQGKQLTTHLWSHHPKLFDQHIDNLQQRLSKHGLEVDEIHFHQGLPKQSPNHQTRPPEGLLDVEA